jgi:hypothetical protein
VLPQSRYTPHKPGWPPARPLAARSTAARPPATATGVTAGPGERSAICARQQRHTPRRIVTHPCNLRRRPINGRVLASDTRQTYQFRDRACRRLCPSWPPEQPQPGPHLAGAVRPGRKATRRAWRRRVLSRWCSQTVSNWARDPRLRDGLCRWRGASAAPSCVRDVLSWQRGYAPRHDAAGLTRSLRTRRGGEPRAEQGDRIDD